MGSVPQLGPADLHPLYMALYYRTEVEGLTTQMVLENHSIPQNVQLCNPKVVFSSRSLLQACSGRTSVLLLPTAPGISDGRARTPPRGERGETAADRERGEEQAQVRHRWLGDLMHWRCCISGSPFCPSGERDPPRWLSQRFFPFFLHLFSIFFEVGELFLILCDVRETEDVVWVQLVKSSEANL